MEENNQILILEDNTILTQVPYPYASYYADIKNGVIYTARTGEKLKLIKGYERPGKHNYVTTTIMDADGKARCLGIHEIVMAAREQSWDWKHLYGLEVNHMDEKKNNNRGYENLELVIHKDQYSDSVRDKMSREIRGSNHYSAKLDENDVLEIRDRFSEYEGIRQHFLVDIAEEFGVSPSTINALLYGQSWTHI